MTVKFVLCDGDGNAVKLTTHGELIVGNSAHSVPYNTSLSAAGVENVVPLKTNNVFIMTYVIVASDKTNVETQVDIYETKAIDGDVTTAESVILSGSLARSDRVILSGLDLETLPSRFINIQTDTAAVISVTVMGYYESEQH